MELLFWIFLGLVVYTYVGYGLVLFILIILKRIFSGKPNPDQNNGYTPSLTLVVPSYNEEGFIEQKIKNSLELKYPADQLRIIFITDGSTDSTPDIVRKYPEIELMHSPERGGKSKAMNRAMTVVTSEVVVFCEANTDLNPEALLFLARHYANEKVGGVSGEKKVVEAGEATNSGAGEGLYWKYESTLKKWDAELWSIVGAAGELVSFRASLWQDLEGDTILDDFMESLRIAGKGYRFLYEPKAFATETPSANVEEELKRKVRIAAGGWQSMLRLPQLWRIWKHPILTFTYVSHRVLRWSITAFVLPFLFLVNGLLALTGEPIYIFFFLAQCFFFGLAYIGFQNEKQGKTGKLTYVPYYFSVMNYAVWAGFLRHIKGSQKATWERSKRQQT
jgi:cellulose synthase/poly-beta-1,6-N-acetylglucosamine synthase-like glycosyltransferase